MMSENISGTNSSSIDCENCLNENLNECVGNIVTSSTVSSSKTELNIVTPTCAGSGISSDKLINVVNKCLVDYPLSDSDSESEQNSFSSESNSVSGITTDQTEKKVTVHSTTLGSTRESDDHINIPDTKIIEVASKPLSRLPDGYELEAADDESSDSTSSFSDDYELCGYESDHDLNNLLGICDVKDKNLLIEEASTTPEIMDISVNENMCQVFGKIMHIMNKTVVVESVSDNPALDSDTILFLNEGKRTLGKIAETFGPVSDPHYIIYFGSEKIIAKLDIVIGQTVFYAPHTEYTVYVAPDILSTTGKGSDASWVNNAEPPPEYADYSDDERERSSRSVRIGKKRVVVKQERTENEPKNKEMHRNFVDCMNKRNAELSAKRAKEDELKMWSPIPIKQESHFDALPTSKFVPSDLVFNLPHSSPTPFYHPPAPVATSSTSTLFYNNSLPSIPRFFYGEGRLLPNQCDNHSMLRSQPQPFPSRTFPTPISSCTGTTPLQPPMSTRMFPPQIPPSVVTQSSHPMSTRRMLPPPIPSSVTTPLPRSMSARMFPPPFPSSVVNTSSPRPLSNYVIPPTITQCVPNSSPSVSWQNYPSRPPLRPMMHHHPNSRATFMPGVMNINNTNIWEEARPTSYSSSPFPEPRHHSGDCYPPGSGYPPR